MRLLQRYAKVTTRFGGGFVQSINGCRGRTAAEPRRLVLLRQRRRGAPRARRRCACTRATGSGGTATTGATRCDVPAVVGSFPEPFLHGFDGKRLPVRIECSPPDAPGATRSSDAARRGRRRRRARRPARRASPRRRCAILVGLWPAIRDDPRPSRSSRGPQPAASTRAWPRDGRRSRSSTRRATRADARRRAPASSPPRALEHGQPIWVVTGTDAGGARGRRRGADETGVLHNRFALVTDQGRPLSAPGRAEPCTAAVRARCTRPRAAAGALYCIAARARAASPEPAVTLRARSRRWRSPPRCGVGPRGRGRRAAQRAVRARHGARSTRWSCADGLTVFARLGDVPVFGQLDITLEAPSYGGVARRCARSRDRLRRALRAAVDPDDLLRAFRRLSFRSALTRDARDAAGPGARPRRAPPGRRAALPAAAAALARARRRARASPPARWTARSTSRRRWRCAATAARGRPPRTPAPVVAPRPRASPRAAALVALGGRRRSPAGGVRRLPALHAAGAAASRAAAAVLAVCACAVRGPPGDRAVTPCSRSTASPTRIRARAAALAASP